MEIISSSLSKSEYSDILIAVKEIKKAIIESRYQLAKLVKWQSVFYIRQSVTADLESALFPVAEFVINPLWNIHIAKMGFFEH